MKSRKTNKEKIVLMSDRCENCKKLEDELLRLFLESTATKIPTWDELKEMTVLRVKSDEYNERIKHL